MKKETHFLDVTGWSVLGGFLAGVIMSPPILLLLLHMNSDWPDLDEHMMNAI